jgi:hypothetical protein
VLSKLLTAVVVLAATGTGWANTYRVRTAADPGRYSLRWAIWRANSHAGDDQIIFAKWLAGRIIYPGTPLPRLTDPGTAISGDINGDGAPDIGINGTKVARRVADGLWVEADRCQIRGLSIVRFTGHGIVLSFADDCVVAACHIGVSLGGTVRAASRREGILIDRCARAIIGGSSPADRNVMCSLHHPCLRLSDSTDCRISGNYIGLGWNGTQLADGDSSRAGIDLQPGSDRNTIGGGTGSGNVFGDLMYGLLLNAASDCHVAGNWFGLEADGNTEAPIEQVCLELYGGAHGNTIGGLGRGFTNVFAGNAHYGVTISHADTVGNLIQANRFGMNAAGTQRRQIGICIALANAAGANTIGGSTSKLGNYFTPNLPPGPTTTAVRFYGAGADSNVQNNRFGMLPLRKGWWAHGVAVHAEGVAVSVTDNTIAAAGQGVLATGANANPAVYRNTFRLCETAVAVTDGADCRLGNLGNRWRADDGGNVFIDTVNWHIYNATSHNIPAEGNDFGTTSSAEIDLKIYDHLDNPARGLVDYSPLMGGVIPTGGAEASLALSGLSAIPSPAGAQVVFTLSSAAAVQSRILNIAGRPIRTLCRAKDCDAGTNTLLWNAMSDQGLPVPSGRYLVEVTAKAADGGQVRALGQVVVGP